jgi:hypothetical protein
MPPGQILFFYFFRNVMFLLSNIAGLKKNAAYNFAAKGD